MANARQFSRAALKELGWTDPIPWAYQAFIHWDRIFVLYKAE